MIELIRENKFEELKEVLRNSEEHRVHYFLAEILNGKEVEIKDESFLPPQYQTEFLEGLQLYKALEQSSIDTDSLRKFSNLLVHLSFIMSSYIHVLADEAMSQGVYLTDLGHIQEYKLNPEIRARIQEFIDLLKSKTGEEKAIANLASAKAKISSSIGNILEKHEIGDDMLQFAQHFENVGEIEIAIRIHQGIMNDFECDSVKLSSGLIPEMSHVDDRPEEEIEIFNKAKMNYERLTGHEIEEPNRVHIKDRPVTQNPEKTAATENKNILNTEEEHKTSDTKSKPSEKPEGITSTSPYPAGTRQNTESKDGFLEKLKRMFRKN